MFIKKLAILAAVPLVFLALQPLTAQISSDSARLEKLERAVEQLQKRNAELESDGVCVRRRRPDENENHFRRENLCRKKCRGA